MSQERRADELLDSWRRATDRPTPAFTPRAGRPRRAGWAAAVLVLIVVGLLVVGTIIVIGALSRPRPTTLPAADIVAMAPTAISSAPGARFSLSIAAAPPEGVGLVVDGHVDLEKRRFSGTAHGVAPGQGMLLFGGPANGAAVIADGVFVRTEDGAFERQADETAAQPLERVIDGQILAGAIREFLDGSMIDPSTELVDCPGTTCQVVRFNASPKAVFGLFERILGQDMGDPPADLDVTRVQATVDQATGFPVLVESTVQAGETTISITARLERLEPAPSITEPPN